MSARAEKLLRLWYGWHGYTQAEKSVRAIVQSEERINAEELLARCLEHSDKMPPRPVRRAR